MGDCPEGFHTWPLERRNQYFAQAARDYDARKATQAAAPAYVPAYTKGLKVLDGQQLLSAKFPPRSLMLAPWLPEKGLAMIYSPRGVGKTWIALSIAHAIASGGELLCWRASAVRAASSTSMAKCRRRPCKSGTPPLSPLPCKDAPRQNFRLVAADVQPDGLPDLGRRGRAAVL